MRDLVDWRLPRDSLPAVSKFEIWLLMQEIWTSLTQANNLFDCMPRRIRALIAARGGYTKYWFRTLIAFYFLFENFVIYLYQYKSFMD